MNTSVTAYQTQVTTQTVPLCDRKFKIAQYLIDVLLLSKLLITTELCHRGPIVPRFSLRLEQI